MKKRTLREKIANMSECPIYEHEASPKISKEAYGVIREWAIQNSAEEYSGLSDGFLSLNTDRLLIFLKGLVDEANKEDKRDEL